MGQPRWSGSVKGSGGGSGTVKKVASANGSIAVTTPTIDPTIEVAKVPASALVSGTRITIATSTGKAEISAAATTKVTLAGDVTGTSTANVVSKVPAAAVTAGTNIAVTTVTGKAEVSTDALGGDVTGTLAANTVAKVPAAAVTAGTGTTITTVTGKAKVGVPTAPITAETSATGVALINGTQTILSVTAPNDGKVHTLLAATFIKDISTALTGGTIILKWTTAANQTATHTTTITSVGITAYSALTIESITVRADTTITLSQTTAVTAGAAKVYAKIVLI